MDYKLYIIIVTYNGGYWIEKCLNSVYNSTILATPIVIDNCSTDSTVSIIKDKYPNCILIESKENLGFGRANNRGIKLAIENGADYVYLLNQDAWVEPNTFADMIDAHQKHLEYGVLSPIQMTGNGESLDPGFKKNAVSKKRCPDFLTDYEANYFKKDVYSTYFVMAAHWLLYVPHLNKVGLFSPAFPHYGEDANLVSRFKYHGYKIGICSRAFACHDREYRKNSPEKDLYMKYIVYITLMNNLLVDSFIAKFNGLIHMLVGCIKIKGVSLSDKFKTISKAIIEGCKASYYKKEYIKTNSKIY